MGPTSQAAPGTRPNRRPDGRSIWVTPRAAGMHLTLLVVVPVFVGLFWWQVQRVRQGNTLSWAYVFEWPFFAGYAIYMWWKLVHDQAVPAGAATAGVATAGAARAGTNRAADPGLAATAHLGAVPADTLTPDAASTGTGTGAAADTGAAASTDAGITAGTGTTDTEDEELAAYNRYLTQLDASGRRKHW